ncbi:unnamed protein product [Thlaspi arvense]|uniref:Uncharacterized protein n=1 Tax=Thlaspi arvense TaxID=13288 RepID=A0AAU9RZJ6_THLAR|nr:unnamed protein product [Thlaspi arvense]
MERAAIEAEDRALAERRTQEEGAPDKVAERIIRFAGHSQIVGTSIGLRDGILGDAVEPYLGSDPDNFEDHKDQKIWPLETKKGESVQHITELSPLSKKARALRISRKRSTPEDLGGATAAPTKKRARLAKMSDSSTREEVGKLSALVGDQLSESPQFQRTKEDSSSSIPATAEVGTSDTAAGLGGDLSDQGNPPVKEEQANVEPKLGVENSYNAHRGMGLFR